MAPKCPKIFAYIWHRIIYIFFVCRDRFQTLFFALRPSGRWVAFVRLVCAVVAFALFITLCCVWATDPLLNCMAANGVGWEQAPVVSMAMAACSRIWLPLDDHANKSSELKPNGIWSNGFT